jgi:hypothetical protein
MFGGLHVMKKIIAGLLLSLLATASYAQSTITFAVQFNKFYAAAGNFVPNLTEFETDPITLTGVVTLTAVASGTQLTGGSAVNNIVLNGSWNSIFAFNPPDTQQTFTYDNAVFDLFSDPGYFANDFLATAPQPIFTGTSTLGELSDHGPAALYGGTCPFTQFGSLNCQSLEPAIDFAAGTAVFDTDSQTALFPALADAGWHDLLSGSVTATDIGSPSLSHDNGLDGFYFEGGLDTSVPGAIVPGGIVRIVMTSATGETMYVLEGTTAIVPVPAAVWLFGSALGLLAWVRRRVAA